MFNILTFNELLEQQNIGSYKIPMPVVYPSTNYAGKWTEQNYDDIVGQLVSFDGQEKEIQDIYSDNGEIFFVDKDTNVFDVKGKSVEIKNRVPRVYNKLDPYGEEVWEAYHKSQGKLNGKYIRFIFDIEDENNRIAVRKNVPYEISYFNGVDYVIRAEHGNFEVDPFYVEGEDFLVVTQKELDERRKLWAEKHPYDPYGEEIWEGMKNYTEFVNEARAYHIKKEDYVQCGGNFGCYTVGGKTIKAMVLCKGKYAKVLNSRYKMDNHYEFELEFEEPVDTKDENKQKIKIKTFYINQNQVANLRIIKNKDFLRWKAGFTLPYKATSTFDKCINRYGMQFPYKYYDVSYFDVDAEKNDIVSFLPANKSNLVVDENGNNLPGENAYTSKFRQSTKVGRVIRKLNDQLTDQQIEEFTTKYKANWNYWNKTGATFIDVVTGDKIAYWYDSTRYAPGNGTLNNSCMRDPSKSYRIQDFYGKYPDKIALCILVDVESQMLLGRALIWKLDKPEGVIFMDRIYYIKPEHEKLIEDYAKKQGMQTKLSNYHLNNRIEVHIDYKPGTRNGSSISLPYLDTFQYDSNKKKFINK
jgi:hypothetical protein